RTRAAHRFGGRRPEPGTSGGTVALLRGLSRFACLGLRELGVGSFGTNLPRRSGVAGAVVILAVAHRLLEPAYRVTQIATDRRELLGAEHHEHDEQNHDQLAHPNTHNSNSRLSQPLMTPDDRTKEPGGPTKVRPFHSLV